MEGDTPEPPGVSSANLYLCKLLTKPASTTSSAHNKRKQHRISDAFFFLKKTKLILFLFVF